MSEDRRLRAFSERRFGFTTYELAVTRGDFIKISRQVVVIASEAEEEFLQRKVVKDDHATELLHSFEDSRVIAVVVAHVIDDRVKAIELIQTPRLRLIINNLET